jgi:hypothetical protein
MIPELYLPPKPAIIRPAPKELIAPAMLPGMVPVVAPANGLIATTIALSDIVGWWDYQEGSGTSLVDEVGGSNGTASATSWVATGPTNLPNGLDFVPASNSYVDYGFNPSLANGTVCAWVRMDATTGTYQTVVGAGNYGGDFELTIDASEFAGGWTRVGGADRTVWDPTPLTAGTLYFLAYSWTTSAATDLQKLWKNGSLVQSASGTWGTISLVSTNLCSGRRTTASATLEFDGKIYQVMLFNRELTTAEILQLYNSGAGATFSQFDFA